MEKQLHPGNSENDIWGMQHGLSVKFVIVQEEEKTKIIFSRRGDQHVTIAETALHDSEKGVFVGAGLVTGDGSTWGSTSCDEKYRRHMPNDPELASRLLGKVRQNLLELLGQY